MQTIMSPPNEHLPDNYTTVLNEEARVHLEESEKLLTERDEILAAIAFHDAQLIALRAKLPTSVKNFYRFRCKPERFVWVYAANREQAEARLNARMNQSYGNGWSMTVNVVDVYENPIDASANTPGNLFRCLSESEAREFLEDWKANQRGRGETKKLKDVVKNQLEHDAEEYEKRLRQIANSK
jgi:hypothetical protein